MERARAGILGAAAELIAEAGLRGVTMAAVSRRGRVAKATVYNHFRDREELVRAVLQQQRQQLVAECARLPRERRLDAAARWLGSSPVVGGLRRHDPAVLVQLAGAAVSDPLTRSDVEQWIDASDDTDRAIRWLVSFVVAPASSAESVT
jgi:AcrR family transcriptional regulator